MNAHLHPLFAQILNFPGDGRLSGGVESRHAAEGCEVSNKRGVGSNAEMLSASCATDKGGHSTQRSTHSAGGPVRSCAATDSGSSAPPAQIPFATLVILALLHENQVLKDKLEAQERLDHLMFPR